MTVTAERPAIWAAVEAVQAGDMDAFGNLYAQYRDVVFRFIHYRVGNRQVCEDLCSLTFTRALASIGGVRWVGKDFGAYLVTIARNLIADHHKSAAYRLSFPAGVIYEDDTVQVDHAPDTADLVTDRAIGEILADAVSYLNDEQRTCIELRFYQGLSIEETATAMGKNAGAIKALQFRAVGSLRRLLDGLEVR